MESTTLAAFSDELEKISSETSEKAKRYAKIFGGALLGGGVVAGGIIAARPALRAQAKNFFKTIGSNKYEREVVKANPEVVRKVSETAKKIADTLRARGIDPKTARIAVSGTGGTGKSTLARALSEEMGMGVRSLDAHIAKGTERYQGRALTNYLGKHPPPSGMVFDQTHLLNQVDPDKFDVIIRVHKPMKEIKHQIVKRGRSAGQLEFYNYPKLDKSIEAAFENTAGNALHIAPGVQVKVKPPGGFRADDILDEKAVEKGFDPFRMTRSQKILAVAHGETGGSGVEPYVRRGRLATGGGLVAGGAGTGGYIAGRETKERRA